MNLRVPNPLSQTVMEDISQPPPKPEPPSFLSLQEYPPFPSKKKSLYTIVWYDCPQCRILLDDMNRRHVKYLFIENGLSSEMYPNENPLIFRDSYFVSDNIPELYQDLYPM
jgi:hypothetical protein